MQVSNKNIESSISKNINDCAISILKSNPDLHKFRMKLKMESQKQCRITLHAVYEGQELCSSAFGQDVWLTFKMVEVRFLKKVKKAKSYKLSKIRKLRNDFNMLFAEANSYEHTI